MEYAREVACRIRLFQHIRRDPGSFTQGVKMVIRPSLIGEESGPPGWGRTGRYAMKVNGLAKAAVGTRAPEVRPFNPLTRPSKTPRPVALRPKRGWQFKAGTVTVLRNRPGLSTPFGAPSQARADGTSAVSQIPATAMR